MVALPYPSELASKKASTREGISIISNRMTLDYIIPFFIGSIPTTSATSIPAILVKGIKPYCTAPSIVDIPLNCQRGNTRYGIRE